MPIFKKRDVSVLFIHIPKTGGTTIEDTLLRNGFEMSYRRGGRYGERTGFDTENGCSPQHMHAELLQRHFADREFAYVFSLVRHPLARFNSEYRFRVANGHPLARNGINAFARDSIWRFSKRNPMVLDNHIRPQSEFVWRSCPTFRLEDGMNAALARISGALGEELKPAGLTSMRSDELVSAALSSEMESALCDFYGADFKAFGYE